MRLLVVEDEAITALYLKSEFSRLGYSVSTESRGEDALSRTEEVPPEAVLMDIHLAGELNGIETARALCDRGAGSIFFMSGYEREDLEERLRREYGPEARIFSKPLRTSDIEVIDRFFRAKKL